MSQKVRAFMAKKSQHVVPNLKGGWSVKSEGALRAVKRVGAMAS